MITELGIALFLLVASIIDIKIREVPNMLSYGLLTLVSLDVLVRVANSWDFTLLLTSAVGLIVAGLIGLSLYRSGQWGGGDVKLLLAMGVYFGLQWKIIPEFVTFFLLMFLIGGLIGIFYSVYAAFANFKQFKVEANKLIRQKNTVVIRFSTLTSAVILLVVALILRNTYSYILVLIAFLLWTGFYLWILVKAVEDVTMIKERAVHKLVEGDWLLNPVKKGNVVVKPREIGLTKKDLVALKKMKIKSVTIKEGLPFVPSFFLAYIIMIYFTSLIPF